MFTLCQQAHYEMFIIEAQVAQYKHVRLLSDGKTKM